MKSNLQSPICNVFKLVDRVKSNKFLTTLLTLFMSAFCFSQMDADSKFSELNSTSGSSNVLLSCTQYDMDPCAYLNMSSFTSALVTELNNQLNNCPARNWDCNPSPCCTTQIVIALSSLPSGTINPYFYCLDADCTTFYCIYGDLHNYTDVALQNAILSDIRNKAYNARPYCGSSTTIRAGIYSYQVFLQNYGGSCTSGGDPCLNAEIKVRVTYACNCGEEG